MREHLAELGLTLCDVTTRQPDPEAAARFTAAIRPGLEALGIDPHDYAQRGSASHLIWRVRRGPCQRIILSGNMLDPVGGVSHLRVVYPLQAIGTDPAVMARVTDRVSLDPPPDDAPRIFVLHRPSLLGRKASRCCAG